MLAGCVTVLVTLHAPPLAASHGRTLAAALGARRLDVRSAGSREYLAKLARLQARAAAQLHRAIPQAQVGRKLRVILDALTVRLPVRQLPRLYRLGFVRKVYPSARFSPTLDDSPSMIGVPAFSNSTGARGEGVKIGVVDDGIDQTSAFLDPKGFTYPAGFPRGQTKYTTPKVIVARSYPGPGSGKPGTLPLDRKASFHGTHVAGIAAGDAGTTAPAGPDHPEVKNLSGVAPRAWLGSYRVFNAPTPAGNSAFTPQIVAAFEDAVSDGMDVINFSGGGPMLDPRNDALVEAVHNVAAAGVIPVISAGNDRDDFGLGSVGAPGTAPDAISVAAVSNAHVFMPTLTVLAPGGVARIAVNGGPKCDAAGLGDERPEARRRRDDRRYRRQARRPAALRPTERPRGARQHPADRVADRRDRARLARLLHVRLEDRPRKGCGRCRRRLRRQPSRRGGVAGQFGQARAAGRDDRRRGRREAADGGGCDRRPGDGPRRP